MVKLQQITLETKIIAYTKKAEAISSAKKTSEDFYKLWLLLKFRKIIGKMKHFNSYFNYKHFIFMFKINIRIKVYLLKLDYQEEK